MKNVVFVLILLIFASCSENRIKSENRVKKDCYYPVPDEVTMLTDENMPEVETFTMEKIPLPAKYQNSNYYVYQDSLVVVRNNANPLLNNNSNSNSNPYVICVYNLNTQQEIAGYLKKGDGPNEFLSFGGHFNNENLLLKDGNLHAFTQINMDSIVIKRYNYVPKILYHDAFMMTDFALLGNDTIVSANGMFIKGFDVDEVPEFELYDAKTGKALQKYPKNEKNIPAPSVMRTMTYSNSKYIVCWNRFPVISIYDKNFNIIKQYRDSKYEDCKLSLHGEINTIAYLEDNPIFFN
ncbi:MAG: hypothetical protein J6Z01_15700 [Bacteroidales bacterium]|nr:hypothetical protein [Bacteroidales bacterium]